MEIDKNAAAAAAVGDLVVFTCANAYSPIDCLLFAFVPSVSFSLSDSLVSLSITNYNEQQKLSSKEHFTFFNVGHNFSVIPNEFWLVVHALLLVFCCCSLNKPHFIFITRTRAHTRPHHSMLSDLWTDDANQESPFQSIK